MTLRGRIHVYGDDINTDYIIAAKYRSICLDMKDMAKHTMEDLDPEFVHKVKKGDFIVAGKNFGCGSSREYAPKVILETGIAGIIAVSFGRVFYRNSINSGLPLIECDTASFRDGDEIEVDLEGGFIRNLTQNKTYQIQKIPPFMMTILNEGGMVGYLKKYKELDMSRFE
jgi:3-isopropylmalate/(R)-2-methylmalate dehydratase small subunit